MTDAQETQQFCRYCGAGIGKFRREGEGTCEKCDPKPDAQDAELIERLRARVFSPHGGKHHWNLTVQDSELHRDAAARIAALSAEVAKLRELLRQARASLNDENSLRTGYRWRGGFPIESTAYATMAAIDAIVK